MQIVRCAAPVRPRAVGTLKASGPMSQPVVERRSSPRRPAAYAFWMEARGRAAGAWMVDVSEGGAGFLVGAAEAPACGEVVGLREMPATDCHVQAVAQALPPAGRVVRVEQGDVTRRVAVRFEEGVECRVRKPAAAGWKSAKRQPVIAGEGASADAGGSGKASQLKRGYSVGYTPSA
jgi:hypothetical protein